VVVDFLFELIHENSQYLSLDRKQIFFNELMDY
jgi:hypothetical protein